MQTSILFPANHFNLSKVRAQETVSAFQPDHAQYEAMEKPDPKSVFGAFFHSGEVIPPDIGEKRVISKITQKDIEEESEMLEETDILKLIMSKVEVIPVTGCYLWRVQSPRRNTGNAYLQITKNTETGPIKFNLPVKRELYQIEYGVELTRTEVLEPQCGLMGCMNPHHQKKIKTQHTLAKRLAIAKQSLEQAIPFETARAIHADMSQGMSGLVAAARYKVSSAVVYKITNGKHISGLPPVVLKEGIQSARSVPMSVVLGIKKALKEDQLTLAQIAEEYKVSSSFVQNIKYGKIHKNSK